MKKYPVLWFFFLFLFAAVSCSPKQEKETEGESPSQMGEPAEKPLEAQQENETDKDTVEITLKALGNTMAEMKFDKEEIKVPANSIVKLTLVNEGEASAMMHNFVLVFEGTMEATAKAAMKAGPDKEYIPDVNTVIAFTPLAQPQQTVEVTFEAPDAGAYEYICSYPGHWQKMNGKFIVE